MDFDSAYLNSNMDKPVLLEVPLGWSQSLVDYIDAVLLVKKGLYGLKQAGRLWYCTLLQALVKLGFTQVGGEDCLHIWECDGRWVLLLVFADDLLLMGSDNDALDNVKSSIKGEFKAKDLGIIDSFIGMKVEYTSKGITLSQPGYATSVVQRFAMQDAHASTLPLPANYDASPEDSVPCDVKLYQELLGCLLHLTNFTRPDLTFSVGLLCRHMANPRHKHLQAAKQVVKYVKGTMNAGITFDGSTDLVAYCDSDWAGDRTDRKSTSGGVILAAGGPVWYYCRKQTCTALSSVEAEYVSASETAKGVSWINKASAPYRTLFGCSLTTALRSTWTTKVLFVWWTESHLSH